MGTYLSTTNSTAQRAPPYSQTARTMRLEEQTPGHKNQPILITPNPAIPPATHYPELPTTSPRRNYFSMAKNKTQFEAFSSTMVNAMPEARYQDFDKKYHAIIPSIHEMGGYIARDDYAEGMWELARLFLMPPLSELDW